MKRNIQFTELRKLFYMNNMLEELKDSAPYLAKCRYLVKILRQYVLLH